MFLTEALKAKLVELGLAKSDSSDDDFRKAAGDALVRGLLTIDEVRELNTPPEAKAAGEISQKMDALLDAVSKLITSQAATKQTETKEVEQKETETKETATKQVETPDWNSRLKSILSHSSAQTPEPGGSIRVKGAYERYNDTKSVALFPSHTKRGAPHPKAGRPMEYMGKPVETASERDKAVAGVFCKFLLSKGLRGGSKSLGFNMLNEHEKELLLWSMESMPWSGASDGGDYADIKNRPLQIWEQKALIDDGGASGGMEAAPIVFDDMVIQAPLLNGELFPDVNVIPLDRGRRVEAVSMGTVTGLWNGVDDTAMTLFTTTSYVAAFDTTIYRWEGAIRIGLDLLSDSPIDLASIVTQQYGERLLEDLDDVIANGNGTNQPSGIYSAVGTSVTFGGSTTLSAYESLRFSVSKQEHGNGLGSSAAFIGSETSYQRARAIPVSDTDARRIFGMDYDTYSLMGRPYKINASLGNTRIIYAILNRYRMYQRRGLFMRTSTEGDTLIRNNEMLIVCMARYGGQLERSECAAASNGDAPA